MNSSTSPLQHRYQRDPSSRSESPLDHYSNTRPRSPERPTRPAVPTQSVTGVVSTSNDLQNTRRLLGSPHDRLVRLFREPSPTSLLQPPLRPRGHNAGRLSPRLDTGERLHQSAVQTTPPDPSEDPGNSSDSDRHRPFLAERPMVPPLEEDDDELHSSTSQSSARGKRRATEQSKVEAVRLQDIWQQHVGDWDVDTRATLEHALRPSTVRSYDGILTRFKTFCFQHQYEFCPAKTSTIAHFLKTISEAAERPGPLLISACAAIASIHKGVNIIDPTKDQMLILLKRALVNSSTKRPKLSPYLPS